MSFSFNEVHMLLRKALCGRKLAFGLADDMGAVGARLSAQGQDGVAAVLALDNAALIGLMHAVEAGTPLYNAHDQLALALRDQLNGAAVPRARAVAIAHKSWQAALDLAQHTYVPETEASRLGGAGAGTNDND